MSLFILFVIVYISLFPLLSFFLSLLLTFTYVNIIKITKCKMVKLHNNVPFILFVIVCFYYISLFPLLSFFIFTYLNIIKVTKTLIINDRKLDSKTIQLLIILSQTFKPDNIMSGLVKYFPEDNSSAASGQLSMMQRIHFCWLVRLSSICICTLTKLI